MKVIQSINNHDAILQMYRACLNGTEIEVRGSKVRNVHNMMVMFDTMNPVLTDFVHRKLNLNYCKREWLWYLGADKFDDSIAEHAKAWAKLKQPDGSYYSNYGQYMFGRDDTMSQFEYVVKTLRHDPNSRRASMVLLSREHLFEENADVVCTYAINFTINFGYLDMTVMMRSNDVVYGFTNDAFCFHQLFEFVYQLLSRHIEGLGRGNYTHFTNSMHVYERHFKMLQDILNDPRTLRIGVPKPTPQEVADLYTSRGKGGSGEYTTWLKTLD